MKELQDINGYICFKNKTEDDVRHVFQNFKFDSAQFNFIKNTSGNGDNKTCFGVSIIGQINIKYTVDFIVRLFCKLMDIGQTNAIYQIVLGAKKKN
jgi:hypothetical protein